MATTIKSGRHSGFTLIELMITLAVLTIMTMGVIPIVRLSVKRQKEQQLRQALRDMREAIDQFHREAMMVPTAPVGANAGVAGQVQGNLNNIATPNLPAGAAPPIVDPRVRVYITDATIFTVDNPDRYPPDLETLVKGVSVMPLQSMGLGGRGDLSVNATDLGKQEAAAPKKKVYLRSIPIDPMTGKADWEFHSCYQAPDDNSWDRTNVFEVHSSSKETSLNGEKYSDW